ncbi:histidyl-tRNA synthetase [Clostridium cavendishii DSM 21758]|uniref:Histidine--tRNA ligase n=1 Tax=Clostridium cavendishii DSM 21758 TaxID=1121302 RepID=A0A1M6QYB1_9CLOT|nr:histidine--tRNA ligase [Clostridium cavendishii]SHK25057.1 histidyl-tRNA synthetase [Clostridium cavendishii DSM 21758]
MKNKIRPSILPGFMELLPREQRIFNDIVRKITNVYEKNGLIPMDTPIIEKQEILMAKSGGETEKQVYNFKRGDNNLALRFDLTVPLARYVAQYFNDLTFPFKRYQIGKVYRGERNQRGRYREFYQCDVDIIGNGKLDIRNDAFVISIVSQAFKSIGLKEYKFQINNRKILLGLFQELEITDNGSIITLIDKYDKMDKKEFYKDLEGVVGDSKAKFINDFINIKGTGVGIIDNIKKLNISNDTFNNGLKELEEVIKCLKIFGVCENEYLVDFKIIRGLDYYTGTVFETILIGNENFGSICSGGRYDNLAQNYTDNIMPGIGISIGLTRLFYVLKEIGFVDNYNLEEGLEYLILPIGETLEYCFKVKEYFKKLGFSVDVYLEEDKFKKKLNYANKIGVKNVVIVGEDEVKSGNVLIKNMFTGSQIIKKVIENDF